MCCHADQILSLARLPPRYLSFLRTRKWQIWPSFHGDHSPRTHPLVPTIVIPMYWDMTNFSIDSMEVCDARTWDCDSKAVSRGLEAFCLAARVPSHWRFVTVKCARIQKDKTKGQNLLIFVLLNFEKWMIFYLYLQISGTEGISLSRSLTLNEL